MIEYAKGLIIGLAGELRVMSELLLRGHRVAQELIDDGTDIVLDGRFRIQVKSVKSYRKNSAAVFQVPVGKTRRRRDGSVWHVSYKSRVDFIIVIALDVNEFFILPSEIADNHKTLSFSKNNPDGLYRYKDRWDLLKKHHQ